MSDIEQRIRERAFELWEQAGRPHHRGDEFWFAARAQINAESLPSSEAPGDTADFPPNERTLEDPPDAISGSIGPELARIAVPDVHPAEPEAAETTLPRVAAAQATQVATPPTRSAPPAATGAARKAADAEVAAAPPRPPRPGAARPQPARPAPPRPTKPGRG